MMTVTRLLLLGRRRQPALCHLKLLLVTMMHPLRSVPALLPLYASLASLLIRPTTSTSILRRPTPLLLLPLLLLSLILPLLPPLRLSLLGPLSVLRAHPIAPARRAR